MKNVEFIGKISSILIEAIKAGKINEVNINLQDTTGNTVLMWYSISHGNNNSKDNIRLLLNNGADPNIQNKLGYTALMYASIYNNQVVELLLNNGAEINMQNNDGETAIMMAAYAGISRGDNNARMNIVRLLLDNGAEINIKNKDGKDVLQILDKKIKESYSIINLIKPGKYRQWCIKIQKIIKDYKNTQHRSVNNSIFTSKHNEIGYINPLYNLQIK